MNDATIDNQVSIEKTIRATEEVVTFNYRISTPPEGVDRLRLVEELPEPVEPAAVEFGEYDQGRWERAETRELAFTSERPPTDPIETTFRVHSRTLEPEECVSKLTTSAGALVDGTTLAEGTGSTPATDNGSGRQETDYGRQESDYGRQETSYGRRDTEDSGRESNGTDVRRTVTVNASAGSDDPAGRSDRPAVGVLSTGVADDVSRTILEATRRDLPVFVAVADERNATARIARRLGATAVETPTEVGDVVEHEATLLEAVRDASHPGMIYHDASAGPMDFEASLSAFEGSERRSVEAVPESARTNVLVGIPAYNEAETVASVVEAARDRADEVLVVDDGSTDRTASRARRAGATVVEHDRNRGYGRGLKTVFEEADRRDVDALVVLDGDDQHDPRDIPRMLEERRESGAEIVIGNRFGETSTVETPTYRRFGLWVITSLLNLSLGNLRPSSRIRDTQSGFRLYDATAVRSIVERADAIDDGMSASADILYHASVRDFAIAEVPTTITYDVSNANTRHPVSHGFSIVNRIVTTLERNRPMTVLGIPGLLVSLVGVGGCYWTVSNYATTGTLVAEYALLSPVLVLVGMVLLFVSAVQYSLNASLDRLGIRGI